MIPCSVELTNFLSHRCEDGKPVCFDFEGAVLWSVSGDNGAGKSAIFDAISWALFNEHRGGGQGPERLICHGTTKCQAAFIFAVGGQRYRVERSIRLRGKSVTRAAFQLRGGEWEHIDGTDLEKGFKRWRDDLLGLSYDAFTHSLLLRQGGSDQLIAMKPRERFKILAQVVELERYVRLEQRCQERAAQSRGQVKQLERDLDAIPQAEPEAQQALAAQLKQLEAQQKTQSDALHAGRATVEGAKAHDRLVNDLAAKREQVAGAAQLLDSAEEIRANAAEHQTLEALAADLRQAVRARDARNEALEQTDRARAGLGQVDVEALKRTATTAEARAHAAKQEAQRAQAVFAGMNAAMPSLERAINRREEMLQAEAEVSEIGTVAAAETSLKESRQSLKEARADLETAREADHGAQAARRGLQSAISDLDQALGEAAGHESEMICPRCGSAVRPEKREQHRQHLEQERDEKRQEQSAVVSQADATKLQLEIVDQAVADLVDRCAQLEAVRTSAVTAADAVASKEQAATAALANPHVQAWKDPRAELIGGGDAQQLAELTRQLDQEASQAKQRASDLEETVAEAERRSKHAANALAEAEKVEVEQAALVAEHSQEASTQQQLTRAALDKLPEPWASRVQDPDSEALEAHRQRLDQLHDAPAAAARLGDAQQKLAELRGAEQILVKQLAEIPPEHQVGEQAAQAALTALVEEADDTATQADRARAEERTLTQHQQEREEKADDLSRARERARVTDRLLTLLGRQGLQGELVLRASLHIEVYANETLRALTGGTLALQIRAEQQRGAEEITIAACDYAGDGHVTDGSFLSGSEKFRVCVALAAAIGKYAAGGVAVESLIIDEGFGSLDETGRDQMIDELDRLSKLLKRVIVVSHQAEFHDRSRFPHSYRLVRDGSATAVQRHI